MAKRTATKKVVKKATPKKAVAKKEISYKQIGRNMILVIDGQKLTKAFKDKEARENLKAIINTYNKRNSLKKEKEIIDIMLAEKSTSTERKENLKKTVPKKVVKPKQAKSTMSEAEAKAFLEKQGFTVSKKEAKTAPITKHRNGEY